MKAKVCGSAPGRATRRAVIATCALAACSGAVIGWARSVALRGRVPLRVGAGDSIRVTDRRGRLLREQPGQREGRARWVRLSQLSPQLVAATLGSEDQRFYRHRGVDWLAIGRALLLDAARGRVVSGGSTLTMQLARLSAGLPHTVVGKLEQMVLAAALERRLTKRQILEQYFNRAPYGNFAVGAEAAAHRYLSKPASQLSLAEAALLAALPRSPGGYDPFSVRGRRKLRARQRYILRLMHRQGTIDSDQLRRALAERTAWRPPPPLFRAPHFGRLLLSRDTLRDAAVIESTIDLRLQDEVRRAGRRTVERLREHGATNAAAIVVDNRTAEVLAYLGSVDFFDREHDGQVDGARALRQPGSTLKPFTYALGLEIGDSPASLLADLPARFATDSGDYAPRNYDGTYHGPVRLRAALANSYNIPAVRLAEQVTVPRLLGRLRALGFDALDRSASHYGLGLTLGNGEVTLRQLVAAYAALARGGSYLELRTVRRHRSANGPWRTIGRPAPRRVFDRRVAYLISHVLADPLARLPSFPRDGPLELRWPASVKTGTSKSFRDNWTVGYTRELTVGVWVGNFDGDPMRDVSGVSGAGPLWATVMERAMRLLYPGASHEPRPRPAGLVEREICPLSGALAGPHCPHTARELFIRGHTPQSSCTFHRRLQIDRRNGLLATRRCPARFVEHRRFTVYPPRYRGWALRQGTRPVPIRLSPRCPGRGAATPVSASPDATRRPITVRIPADGDRYVIDPDLRRPYQTLALQATVRVDVRAVRWVIDGRVVARASFPYAARWTLSPGDHRVEAILPDGRRSRAIRFSVE